MQIRIKALPRRGEMDEYDLRRFVVGDVYDVSVRLASILIIEGYAEPVSARVQTGIAADSSRRPKS
jgi:hypothetical protein